MVESLPRGPGQTASPGTPPCALGLVLVPEWMGRMPLGTPLSSQSAPLHIHRKGGCSGPVISFSFSAVDGHCYLSGYKATPSPSSRPTALGGQAEPGGWSWCLSVFQFLQHHQHFLLPQAWGSVSSRQAPSEGLGPPWCCKVALPPAAKHCAMLRMDCSKAHFLPPSL